MTPPTPPSPSDPAGPSNSAAAAGAPAPAAAAKPAAPAAAKPAPAPKVVTVADIGGTLLEPSELKQIDIFADIPEATLAMFPGTVGRREFKAGEVICREGEGGTTAFYVVSGEVDVSIGGARGAGRTKKRGGLVAALGRVLGQGPRAATPARSGDAIVPIDATVDLRYGRRAATLGPGEVFGEMSCLNLAPRSATVVAKTDCVLLEILRNIYEKLQASKAFKTKMDARYRERALAGHLRNVPVFATLPESAIERLRTTAELVTKEPGEVIIREGDPADGMYLIRNGQVKVTKKMPGGELTLSYRSRGDTIGEIGLLAGTVRIATCTAVDHPVLDGARKRRRGRVELVKIGAEEFRWLTTEFPAVRRELEALAGERTAATREAVERVVSDTVDQRVEDLGLLQGQRLLLIDLEKCTRCDQCVDACVASHDDHVTRLVREGPRYDKFLVPSRCRMCMDPLCMIGCPVGSIRRTRDLNMFIEDWCVGCGVCAKQCPYESIQMHDRAEFEEPADAPTPPTPAAAAGPAAAAPAPARKEKAVVCDQCSSLPQGPACVYACPHDAAFTVNARQFFQVAVSAPSRAPTPA